MISPAGAVFRPFQTCVQVCNKRELRLVQNQRHVQAPTVELRCVTWRQLQEEQRKGAL